MLRNYLQVAARSFHNNSRYIAVNILGLGISLACCITAYLLIAFTLEFDSFHKDKKVSGVFRIHTLSKDKENKVAIDFQAPMALPLAAASDMPGVGKITRYLVENGLLRHDEETFDENFAFADSTFFELFDFPLRSGNHKFFKDKNSIFLSEELSKKYFGNEDPTGKLLVLHAANETEIELYVGGVLQKIPMNNTFRFPALIRIENFEDIHNISLADWSDHHNPSVFLELTDPENASQISDRLSKYISIRNRAYTDEVADSYSLEPFKSAYDESEIRNSWVNHRMRPESIVIFVFMVSIILLIACFNLTNTSMTMIAKRLKEIGIRKAMGAARKQIISQFLFETLLTILASLGAGLLMAQFIVPVFTEMWSIPYGLEDINGLNLVIALTILVFITALLAGIYPALLGSGLRPILLLKGAAKIQGTNVLTRVLAGSQFALSVVMLIGGIVFIQNAGFQDAIKFGYDKEMIVVVNVRDERGFEAMEKASLENPKILSVAATQHNVGGNNYETYVTVDTTKYTTQAMAIGKNYFETLGLRTVQGRSFNVDNFSDKLEGVIVNTAFLQKTGINDPLDKIVTLHERKKRIIGVVEDHIDNLWRSQHPEPFVFYLAEKSQCETLLVKAGRGDLAEIQKYLQATWKKLNPNFPFSSQYLDDILLAESRGFNRNLKKTFLFMTLLGAILAASGIVALASLNVSRRVKEIGIRKALGASVIDVVELINREFIIILLVSSIAGSVAGFYFSSTVLSAIYAHHIPVGTIPVVAGALIIFCVGISATSTTIFRAARANPGEALKSV